MDKGRIKMTVDSVKVAVDSVARPGIEACTLYKGRIKKTSRQYYQTLNGKMDKG